MPVLVAQDGVVKFRGLRFARLSVRTPQGLHSSGFRGSGFSGLGLRGLRGLRYPKP